MANYTISRPINGITINGNEYLLDENDEVMKFPTEDSARTFLSENGIEDPDKMGISIDLEDED